MSDKINDDELPRVPTPLARPRDHQALLTHPIGNDSTATECYPGWEQHHGRKIRFYVAGWAWFNKISGIHRPEDLLEFGELAVKAANTDDTWVKMVGQKHIWSELGLPQFRAAAADKALFFQKAALIILACELALENQKKVGKITEGWEPLDVYNYMAIVPACWHINDLDRTTLDKLAPSVRPALRDYCKQDQRDFIDEMGIGFTYTLPTAEKVCAFFKSEFPDLGIGNVNPRPVSPLGTRAAASKETVELAKFVRR